MNLFTLPEVKGNAIETPKTYLTKFPDLSTLNQGQRIAFQEIDDFMENPDRPMLVLGAGGGFGKTYLITKYLEKYMLEGEGRKVALTAPTNKAVKVLYRMADWIHNRVEFVTVHSMLCLVERIMPNGDIDFVPDKRRIPDVPSYSLVIVDESSMLQDKLFEYLEKYTADGVKFIFMGDPVQIPPVKSKYDSIPFRNDMLEYYGWDMLTLSEVVRQAADNPIFALTQQMRRRIPHTIPYSAVEDQVWEGDKGVFFIKDDTKDRRKEYLKLLRHMFGSDNFKRDGDFARVIAWRNKTVEGTNNVIRRLIYGKDAKDLEIGEKLVTNEPILQENKVVIPNSEELEVISFTFQTEDVNEGEYLIDYYETEVEYRRFDNTPRRLHIRIVAASGMEAYLDILKSLADRAKSLPKGLSAKAWVDYYNFKRIFADVSYAYCQTAHKSQGSSYDNVIVLEDDIDANNNIAERNRIKYTAFSRPRYRLFIKQ